MSSECPSCGMMRMGYKLKRRFRIFRSIYREYECRWCGMRWRVWLSTTARQYWHRSGS